MTVGIVSWDFDVPREWFEIPLDEGVDTRRWAGSFAQEIAEFLEVGGPIDGLADALSDVQSQLSRRRDPWLTALVAVRAEAPISIGAVITARLLGCDADDTLESLEAQMRRDAEQMEPGWRSHDLALWRDRADADAIYVVSPPESSDAVLFEFTTTTPGYFADIRRDTELVVRTLSVTLDGAGGGPNGSVGGGARRTPPPSRADDHVGVKLPPAIVSVVLLVVGILPLIAADPVALLVIAIIAAVLAVAGALLALGSWRTGEPIGYAESVT